MLGEISSVTYKLNQKKKLEKYKYKNEWFFVYLRDYIENKY